MLGLSRKGGLTNCSMDAGEQNVAFFFKQWGGKNKRAAGRRYRGRIWHEYPLVATPPYSGTKPPNHIT